MLTIEQQVANGVAWLDVAAPGWRERVIAPRLSMHSAHFCICGQVFGGLRTDSGYGSGYDYALTIAGGADADDEGWSEEHGFNPLWDRYEGSVTDAVFALAYRDLDEAWQAELRQPALVSV